MRREFHAPLPPRRFSEAGLTQLVIVCGLMLILLVLVVGVIVLKAQSIAIQPELYMIMSGLVGAIAGVAVPHGKQAGTDTSQSRVTSEHVGTINVETPAREPEGEA